MDPVAAALRGQIAGIVAGALFLFAGIASGAIAALGRRARVQIFVWLGVWSAMYGIGRLSGAPAFLAALPPSIGRSADYINVAAAYLIVVPALLAFRELGVGAFRRIVAGAAALGLAIGALGIGVFAVTGSRNALIPYNNVLAASMLVVLVSIASAPRLSSRYFVFHDRGVLIAGTLGFAIEALYSNVSRPLGLPRAPIVDDVGFALLLFSLAYVALELVLANERRLIEVDHELEVARTIQLGILPRGVPSLPGLRISATYRPMTAVAGDFYEFVVVDDARIGILVADAAGHGVPAALIASMVKVAMQMVVSCAHDPGAVLAGLNRVLSRQSPIPLVSAAYLWVDTGTRTARYSAAGHPPMLRYCGGTLESVSSNGFLLGMAEECVYPVVEMPLATGDRFLLYTDGLVEVEDGRGEFFGDAKLEDTVRRNAARPCEQLSEDLLAEIDRWRSGSTPQQDDVTLVIVDIAGSP